MKKRLIVFAIVVLMIGCKKEINEPTVESPVTRETYSIFMKDVTISNRTITLTLDCEVPDPSWEYSHYDASRNQNTIDLKVFAKQIPNITCAAVLSVIRPVINIQVPTSGSYTIHYKSGYSSFRDTTFIFN